MKSIFGAIDTYYKIATLLGDMAHRAMYSIIPGGRFDVIAARWAAQGAVDILYYGTKEVQSELRYYNGDPSNYDPIRKIELGDVDKKGLGDYIKVLTVATKLFYEPKIWDPAYGGPAWGKIAQTLLDIAGGYWKWLHVERGSKKEEEILRRIIINLNIFDGLSHNTGTMYDKMTYREAEDNKLGYGEAEEQNSRINRLRDLTELKDPKYLYREIKDLVSPMRVYKDYETELLNSPEYHQTEDVNKQIIEIRRRKVLKSQIGELIELYQKKIEHKTQKIINRLAFINDLYERQDMLAEVDGLRYLLQKVYKLIIQNDYIIKKAVRSDILMEQYTKIEKLHLKIKEMLVKLEDDINKKESNSTLLTCGELRNLFKEMSGHLDNLLNSI